MGKRGVSFPKISRQLFDYFLKLVDREMGKRRERGREMGKGDGRERGDRR